jgi:hypothetical protein
MNEVDEWLEASNHPQRELIQKVREAILTADARVAECIKWKSPTFTFKGNIASINPQAKAFVSLMFHQGALIPGEHPALQGGGDTARYMRFESDTDLEMQRGALQTAVRAWCDWKAG